MLFPTVLPEAERGSYSIYSYLPLKHCRLCPSVFFLLCMKASWQVIFKEMKTMNLWAELLNCSVGFQGLGSTQKVSCFSKGEERLFAFCFLHEKNDFAVKTWLRQAGCAGFWTSLMLPMGEASAWVGWMILMTISMGTGTPAWAQLSCSSTNSRILVLGAWPSVWREVLSSFVGSPVRCSPCTQGNKHAQTLSPLSHVTCINISENEKACWGY